MGTPIAGKYKLVLGNDEENMKKTISSVEGNCDGYDNSLLVDLDKYGINVYEFDGDVSRCLPTKIK